MKHKIFKLFVCVLAVSLFGGCIKNPLETEPVGNYTTGNFWRNETDVVAGITGIYAKLFEEDGIGHGGMVFEDQSDDISVDGDHADYWSLERFNPLPGDYQIRASWIFAYEQIARCNNAIIYIPKVPEMNEDIRNRSLGEAYFLRAYAYYVLNSIYGEVPKIVEDNVLTGNYNVPKSTIAEIRQLIESDLIQAGELLPETYDAANKGRVSKGSAWGMLTKLYMLDERLPDAITSGQKVISNPNYALATKYADNFTLGKQMDNTELLFAIWNKDGYGNSPANIYFTIRAWNGWGFHHPTQDFVGSFESNDDRKEASVVSVGDSIDNQTALIPIEAKDAYQMFAGKEGQSTGRMLPSMSTTGYVVKKYTAYNPNGNGSLSNDLKQPLLRSADIYLLVAEAKIRQSGAGSGDAEINAIRRRANLPDISGATINDLIHERRMELMGENVRHYDLLRWDKAGIISLDTIVSKPKAASPLPPYNGAVVVPARTFVRPKNYYMPIPQSIIDQSKGVILQNPNY